MGLAYSNPLRRELSELNRAYVRKHAIPHFESYGGTPVVMYPPDAAAGTHGNFFSATYKGMLQEPNWNKRFRAFRAAHPIDDAYLARGGGRAACRTARIPG